MTDKKNAGHAVNHNEAGLKFYETWEVYKAIEAFKEATVADPDNPEYHLNLARAYARSSDYHQAIQALGEYLRTETDEEIASRYEQLFSTALDEVETSLIDTMHNTLKMEIPQIGKAIQMWLEYRITIGRQTLHIAEPALWAAALTYAITKVNFTEIKRTDIVKVYKVKEDLLMERYKELVQTLDLMPADYRYYAGEENPLDKLVEVAEILEELDRRFQEED